MSFRTSCIDRFLALLRGLQQENAAAVTRALTRLDVIPAITEERHFKVQ